jgi:hypothetical protein
MNVTPELMIVTKTQCVRIQMVRSPAPVKLASLEMERLVQVRITLFCHILSILCFASVWNFQKPFYVEFVITFILSPSAFTNR